MFEDETSRVPTPDEVVYPVAGQPDVQRDAQLHEEAADRLGQGYTADWHRTYADNLQPVAEGQTAPASASDVEAYSDPPKSETEDAEEEVSFERIKQDVLSEAKEYALHGIEENFFNGFYDHDKPRRPYARVIKGDFSKGFDQRTIEYDENLTAEETDDIRRAIYEQFGATPPPDEEFDRQKKPREGYPQLGDKLAIVDTPTNMPGVKIQEIRRWRVLTDEIAAEHGIDPLEFTQWFIRVVGDEYVAQPEQPLTPATVESAGTSETETDQNLKEQAEDALKELDRIMDENRQNPNRLVQKSLDQARKYLESLSDLDV